MAQATSGLAQASPASRWLAMPAPALACSAVYVLIGLLTLALAAWYRLRVKPEVPRLPSADDP
jgi:hypothetical protein